MNEIKNQYIEVKCQNHFWRVEKDNILYAEGEDRAPLIQYAKKLASLEGISIRIYDNNDKMILECPPGTLQEKLG
jgi:hypothetical protein